MHAWAYDAEAESPAVEWELLLSWGMDRGRLRQCVTFADDTGCPQAEFFRLVLNQWVEVAANSPDFDVLRPTYDEWLDVARGITNPALKRWRRPARLIFQGLERFDRGQWWKVAAEDAEENGIRRES